MPHMKHFQDIGRIADHYRRILQEFERGVSGLRLLETWSIFPKDKEDIIKEMKILEYILSCQLGFSYNRVSNVYKPSIELVEQCLNRHISFLVSIHRLDEMNVSKHKSDFIIKEYKACKHYLFQFSKRIWYEKLPGVILSFENKYKDF